VDGALQYAAHGQERDPAAQPFLIQPFFARYARQRLFQPLSEDGIMIGPLCDGLGFRSIGARTD